MLELREVFFKHHGNPPLFEKFSFSLRDKEVVGLFGRSGSGKSTLLRLMAGLEKPIGGGIYIDGKKLTKPNPEIGLMFQSYALFDWFTCSKNISTAMRMSGKLAIKGARPIDFLSLVGLADAADLLPRTLSGGMRQRLALARALAVSPHVMLLDEPFAALDVKTRGEIVTTTFEHIRERQLSALLVSHDAKSVVSHCDRVFVLKGTPAQLVVPAGIPSDLVEARRAASDRSVVDILVANEIEKEISSSEIGDRNHAT